tara:strand:- start:1565 stop:1768 length:204 start_codon:yes stop_codon:yes gene_type:complete
MRIIIEDYNGNDLCSFYVYDADNLEEKIITSFEGCNIADVDTDEDGGKICRIQLQNETYTIFGEMIG